MIFNPYLIRYPVATRQANRWSGLFTVLQPMGGHP